MKNKILEVRDLHFSYGEIKALRGISFEVYEGEIVTLLGANGAGKTTTLQSISGLIKGITAGEIIYEGKNVTGKAPHLLAKAGMGQCLEGRLIFSQLTVTENLMMGGYLRKPNEVKETLDYVFELFPRLYERRKQMGGTLSGGEQQMLAIGRAVMGNPRILMMDEHSLGLAPIIIETIFEAIQQINKNGMTVLLNEQNSAAALAIADRGYVLESGLIKLSDTASNLSNNEEVKRVYLGME